ncbi:MAG: SDR family NAD(P)-dependent oxidoreductase, partial [Pseudomonadales bacterium]|nr:SDR family NAD(P)-dependent oxidoreductase [Pseudomonadales bacterium]
DHRQAFSANSAEEAISYLKDSSHERVARYHAPERQREVAFMMAGGGAQFPNMGLDLYEQEPVYREAIDESLDLIKQFIDFDLRAAMFPETGKEDWAAEELQKPSRSVTSIFITQYAQAKLWESWGVKPSAFIGHSLGENTAACLAGVFSLKDALGLVALRGQLFEKVEAGGMLSVQLPEQELRAKLPSALDIAAVNAPELSVVSGPIGELESFQQQLEADEVDCQRVRINIAAHSRMLESILEEFRSYLKSITLNQPEIRIVSNYTGDWLCPIKASTADYWVDHLRNTVRFGEGVAKLLTDNQFILLEVGPGRTLSSLARMSDASSIDHHSLQSMRTHSDERDDLSFMLESFGRLWALNLNVDWKEYYGEEFRHRVPLPTYPFEHKKYWLEPGDSVAGSSDGNRHDDFHRWGYQPVWEPTATSKAPISANESVVLVGSNEFAMTLSEQLSQLQVNVTLVSSSNEYSHSGSAAELDFTSEDQWSQLLSDLKAQQGALPKHIVFAESLQVGSDYDAAIASGFAPLLMLSKALAAEEVQEGDSINLLALTAKSLALHSDMDCNPLGVLIDGPLSVLPSEAPFVVTKHVDIESSEASAKLATLVAKEIFTDRPAAAVIALRGNRSYVKKIRPYDASQANDGTLVETSDTILITGGLGGLGQEMCRALNLLGKQLNLVLINRRSFADPSDWQQLALQSGPGADKAKLLLSLQEAGHKVVVKSADITDLDALAILKDEVAATFGAVNVVVHTAGVIEDSLIAMKEMETVHRVLAPKVKGTMALMETFESDALKRVVLFSSSSSFNGLAGQVDYAAANAFLDAVGQAQFASGSDKVIAVNWPAWKESGMAARIASQQFDAIGGKPAVHPWMGSSNEEQKETDYLRSFSVDKDWVLSEHRIKDAGCLLPGTSYIELGRAAFCEKHGQQPVQISDVIFLSPCFVGDKEEVTVKTSLIEDSGSIEFVVSSYRAGEWVEHAKGKVAAGQTPSVPSYDMASIKSRCTVNKPVPVNGNDQPSLIFGKRWHCAQSIVKGDKEAVIDLKLADEFQADLEWARLHPALLDIATAGVQDIIPGYDPQQHFMIPLGYNAVNYFKPFTQSIVSHVSLAEPVSFETSADHHNDTVSFNVNITDSQGNLLAEIKEFNMKRVQPEFDSDGGAIEDSLDPLLETTLSFGITNEEGQQAFLWALDSLSLPQIIVSPFDANFVMATLKAAANDSNDASGPAISVDRETLSEDFVEPASDLEKQIAAIWRETLGVDQVGTKDNFFELGGHSLLLTRVGTKLKKQLKKELPMSMMFKDPTIEKWSKALEGGGDAAPAKPKTSIKRASRDALRKKRS